MTARDVARKAELAKIHLAKKQLRLDDATYREVVARVCGGKRSAADLTMPERHALLDEFKRLGFQAAPPRDRADDWIAIDDSHPGAEHLRKLLACAHQLERIGAVKSDSTKQWLRKFVKRLTGVDDLRWLTAAQTNSVIEALKGWAKKFEAAHPEAAEQSAPPAPVSNAQPAASSAKAAAYDAMRLVAKASEPAEYIKSILAMLTSRPSATPQIDAAVALLIGEFAERAAYALNQWDYGQAKTEVLKLLYAVRELQPGIDEQMLTAFGPDGKEIATGVLCLPIPAAKGGKNGKQSVSVTARVAAGAGRCHSLCGGRVRSCARQSAVDARSRVRLSRARREDRLSDARERARSGVYLARGLPANRGND
jgi:hypothetical protein